MRLTRRSARAGLAALAAVTPVAAAYRFAHLYRERAGRPRPVPPVHAPDDVDLAYESIEVPSGGVRLPAWWIPAREGRPGPGVLLVHGWESARDRALPYSVFLHAAGFHVLAIDVRGHGANPPEQLPVTTGEFGADAAAGFRALLARPEVTVGAIHGHSLGGVGALLAAAADPEVAAVVAASTASDPWHLTRQTFRLARLPIPDLLAWPLAWLSLRAMLGPRGHRRSDVSAADAAARYRGPLLLVHGSDDQVIPVAHLERLAQAARAGRAGRSRAQAALAPTVAGGSTAGPAADARDLGPLETLVIAGGQHSWLYESPEYRETVARFLARALGGPLDPEAAAAAARAANAVRFPGPDRGFSAVTKLDVAPAPAR